MPGAADTSIVETAYPWVPTAAEREQAAEHLKQAVSDGRLTLEEFNQRLDAVYAARSTAEIHAALASVLPAARPRHRVWWPILGVVAGAILLAGGVAAAARNSAADRHDCGCHRQVAAPLTVGSGRQQTTVPDGAPDPVTCARSVPFSQVETASLSGPFWLPLPGRSQASRCFAVARLSTTTRPLQAAIHIHLDLIFMSGTVQVPRGLGVDPSTHAHTAIFTDNDQGVVTVDAKGTYTLGRLFEEWGHPLGPNTVGHMRMADGYPLHWFVNGAPVLRPESLVLHDHDEIECWQDMEGANIAPIRTYAFPPGY